MTPDSEREGESVKRKQEYRTHRLHCKNVNQEKKQILYRISRYQRHKDGRDVNRSLFTGQTGER